MDVKAYRLAMGKDRFNHIIREMRREIPSLRFQNEFLKNSPRARYEGNDVYMDPASIAHWTKRIEAMGDTKAPEFGVVLTDAPMCLEVFDAKTGMKEIVYPIGYREEDIAAASSFRMGHKKTERTTKVALYELFKLLVEADMEKRGDYGGFSCDTQGCYVKSESSDFSTSKTDIRRVWDRIDHSHGFCSVCREQLRSVTNL